MRAKTRLDEVGCNITVLSKPNPEELREIAEFYGLAWNQPLTEAEIDARAESLAGEFAGRHWTGAAVVLARSGGSLVGCVRVRRNRWIQTEWRWIGLAVHPEHRGKGIARGLFRESVRYVRDNWALSLRSEAHVDNTASIALHQRLGFQKVGTFTSPYDGDRKVAFAFQVGAEEDGISVEQREVARIDRVLSKQYGSYASYSTEHDPVLEISYGDGPADEVDRLLDLYATKESTILDLGCGAGLTLCRLAPRVKAIWGFEQDTELLDVARKRVEVCGLENPVLIEGNNSEEADIEPLPDDAFDLGFSRRGPHMTPWLLRKMKKNAMWVQEIAQPVIGIGLIFGRIPNAFLPHSNGDPNWPVDLYSSLGMVPVSIKTYYFELYFRDADHLESYLTAGSNLRNRPYDSKTDRTALELYARYNNTPHGVRLVVKRIVGVYRRASVGGLPADNLVSGGAGTKPEEEVSK